MDAPVKGKGIDIRKKGIEKIMPNTLGLVLVELESIHEVQLGVVEDPNSH